MRPILLILLIVVCFPLHNYAQATIANGDWEDTLIWDNWSVPSPADTVIVQHFVTFNNNLEFDSPGMLIIDSAHTLCGHYHIDVWCGAKVLVNGQLKMRSMFSEGEVINHGFIHFEESMIYSTPCSYGFSDGSELGGGTFDCLDTSLTIPSEDTLPEPQIPPEPEECDVFIANVFSPNNDSQNDKLFVRGDEITDIQLRIYDRWGNLVFESNDMNHGWDGTSNGKELNSAVFVYYLGATCVTTGERIEKKGNVTLVK